MAKKMAPKMTPPWHKYPDHPPESEIWKYGEAQQYLADYKAWFDNIDDKMVQFCVAVTACPAPEEWVFCGVYEIEWESVDE